jgi:hypothetical protein
MQRFVRLSTIFRTTVAAALYACTAIAVLIGGLELWTEFHLSLRRLGHPTVMLGVLFLCLGATAFPIATWLTQRLVSNRGSRTWLRLATAGPLYAYVIVATVRIIAFPPPDGLEGGDMALRASVLVAVYGIVLNAVLAWCAEGEEATSGNSYRGTI